ncbi:xanthine dehydrogenase family protein molybdopterin-binding subunit [Enterovirga sp.]|uniref:xanthine dehydrogenase family protein molybdopterin-binding subunit n=1 Tax=Enterovirga sp. TaxID=2026350 RepID=UPI002C3E73A6|nr:xanthine dehydrogenase family protein molybdopterin-binding subunit [Enterovirga sp.]HMO29423.1 xanthine dehydrogenase family protein molybdopterin-binding subunit [Enterovirga sp.]
MRNGSFPPVPTDLSGRPGAGGSSAETKFAIGQPVHRREDPILVQGRGRYTDDVRAEGEAHAAFVRSPFAHGVITSVDLEAARAMPGVLAVYGPQDLAHYGDFPNVTAFRNRDGSPMLKPRRKPLALDKVRYVGDPVAFVVAGTVAEAREAAEAVVIEVEQLPAAPTAGAAAAEGAPQLYDDIPGNLFLDFQYGDEARVEEAFARAAHVARLRLSSHRLVINPLEPRAAIGEWDPAEEKYTLTAGSQGAFGMRNMVSGVLGVPKEKLRILTGNVGGSFGMKIAPFPEYIGVLHAARDLGRPVRWTDMRSESFVGDFHGRGIEVEAELALDAEGRFLALRIEGQADLGAYLAPVAPLFATINIPKNAVGVYRTPALSTRMRCYLTNAAPVGAYRGAGRPEGNYIMERLVETAAREMGIDPVAMRRLNHIRPDEIPYATPVETTYDSGEYTALLDRALDAADWDGFVARKAGSAARGLLRGRGIGQYLEVTAPPQNEMGGIRFEADGTVTIVTGTLDYGQGHWTPFAQVLSAHLGVPFEAIRLLQGDSDQLVAGGGTGGSKSIMASGAAIIEASREVIEKGRAVAAELLEAGIGDIEFGDGRFTIAGTDRSIGIMELAARLRQGVALPEGVPRSLDVRHIHKLSPSAYPNGCHVAEVEVDPQTGTVQVVRYVMVNDFGTIVNPLLVEGQLHGGVLQGIGQALLERTAYDEEGQLVSGSFMDYALPRAEDAPPFVFESRPVPATTNPLGAKGCGEAGCAGALPSVMNALVDALREVGVEEFDMPATPARVWAAIRAAREKRPR